MTSPTTSNPFSSFSPVVGSQDHKTPRMLSSSSSSSTGLEDHTFSAFNGLPSLVGSHSSFEPGGRAGGPPTSPMAGTAQKTVQATDPTISKLLRDNAEILRKNDAPIGTIADSDKIPLKMQSPVAPKTLYGRTVYQLESRPIRRGEGALVLQKKLNITLGLLETELRKRDAISREFKDSVAKSARCFAWKLADDHEIDGFLLSDAKTLAHASIDTIFTQASDEMRQEMHTEWTHAFDRTYRRIQETDSSLPPALAQEIADMNPDNPLASVKELYARDLEHHNQAQAYWTELGDLRKRLKIEVTKQQHATRDEWFEASLNKETQKIAELKKKEDTLQALGTAQQDELEDNLPENDAINDIIKQQIEPLATHDFETRSLSGLEYLASGVDACSLPRLWEKEQTLLPAPPPPDLQPKLGYDPHDEKSMIAFVQSHKDQLVSAHGYYILPQDRDEARGSFLFVDIQGGAIKRVRSVQLFHVKDGLPVTDQTTKHRAMQAYCLQYASAIKKLPETCDKLLATWSGSSKKPTRDKLLEMMKNSMTLVIDCKNKQNRLYFGWDPTLSPKAVRDSGQGVLIPWSDDTTKTMESIMGAKPDETLSTERPFKKPPALLPPGTLPPGMPPFPTHLRPNDPSVSSLPPPFPHPPSSSSSSSSSSSFPPPPSSPSSPLPPSSSSSSSKEDS